MRSVLIANNNHVEIHELKETISQEFNVSFITSPKELNEHLERCDLMLLDHNFTEHSGLDFLREIVNNSHLPVLMATPPDDARCATEAMKIGAHNYVVKVGDYHDVLNLMIKEAIEKFNEREQMKQTIVALKNRVSELEGRLGIAGSKEVQAPPSKTKVSIVEDIISRFKAGEINLPSLPQINIKFKELFNKGASLREFVDLLKQDVAISSKLISVSNSAYYRGVVENRTLEQAVSRLGLNTTRQYVEAISNRALYTATNKRYVALIEELWEHSLSCAYASQIVSDLIKQKQPDELFTMGLLHDIGKLVLLQIVGELEVKGKLGEEVDRVELFDTLERYHSKFGATLLKRWQFSNIYTQIAMYHDNIEESDPISKELLVVHFANLLVKSMGYGQRQQSEVDLEGADSAHLLRIDVKVIDEIKDQVKGRMDEMREIFV
jgi:HD-like signal output (HDOD) protein/DNA-binding NarL/FixJ family response regulator